MKSLIIKIVKILLINVFLFLILFCLSELYLFHSFKQREPNAKYNLKYIKYKDVIKHSFPRAHVGLQYANRPIIMIGGSYAYGLFLDDDKTPYYKLSELTKRPVYIYALPGKGLQHAYYILKNKIYDTSIKNPEYIIYIMMDDHIRRMYSPVMFSDNIGYPIFKINHKTGEIKQMTEGYPTYRKFFSYYFIKNIIYFMFFYKAYDIHEKNVFAYFRAMKKEIQKVYPDIKFVIILYDDYNKFNLNFWKLRREGFIVLQTKELTGVNLQTPEYQVSKNDTHPVEAAWDIVIPALVNKLKMNG